jgi:hypothetical protein
VSNERGVPSWFKAGEGAIGPPIAHIAGGAGMVLAMMLAYALGSMGISPRLGVSF